ncbi:hypothetical protein Tco_0831061 [Tanacetum coccineum]
MRIPPWMITEHYKMYADVPMIQSQPTESTQGTHRTLSAPRQSARLTPPAPVPTTEKADEMILQDMIQVSLAEQKSHEEQEARENVALVYEHLAAEEIEKLVEESENVDDSSPTRHDDTSIPGTRIEPRSDKESPEVEIDQEKEEETTKDTEVEPNIVIPVNVDDEEDEITDEVFELRRRAKGKNVEESRISPIPSPTRSPRNLSTLGSSDTEKLQELTVIHPTPSSGSFAPKFTKINRLLSLIKAKPNRFKRYKTFFHELQGRYGYLFEHLKKRFMPRTSSDQLADNLHDVMMEMLPSLVKEKVTEQVKKEVPVQVRDQVLVYLVEGLILERKSTKKETERLIAKAILQERRHMQAQISSQLQNAIDNAIASLVDASVRNYMSGHILHVHPAQVQSSSVPEQHQLYLAMKADPLLQQQDIAISWLRRLQCAKRQKTSEYEAYVSGESSSRQVNAEEPGPSTSGNQVQDDEFDFWTDSYASDDDEIPTKQVTQDIMEEISLTIDEAKLKEVRLWSLSVFIRSSVIWERVHNFQLGIERLSNRRLIHRTNNYIPRIEEYDVFSIVYESRLWIPIYTNSKKEKRAMRPPICRIDLSQYTNSSYLGLRKKYRLSLKNDMPPRDKLEEEKARWHGKVYNCENAKYGKIWYDEDVHDLRSVEIKFPAIVFNDELSSEKTLSCEPTVSSLNNNEIDFRISFDESDAEDYTIIFDKNSYFNDLDFLKDFKNEFPVIVYNDALTSKSDSSTEHVEISHHIDEFNLKTKTSLSECDEDEQNVLYFNDLFLFNIIYPHDLESDTDNDDNEIDIIQSSGVM